MVGLGSGSTRSIDDIALTRYACYLIAQNGDRRNRKSPSRRPISRFTLTIKAKDFATELTSHNVLEKDLKGQRPIAKEHVENNLAVRKMLEERGVKPEALPPAEDVKKVKKRLATEDKKASKSIPKIGKTKKK